MENLIDLTLVRNNLSGPIPESFVNLKNLTTLSLNGNNLTVAVPDFLYDMDSEDLNLEGNNFDLSLTPAQELIRSLETLSEMYEEGLLTDEEFQEAKRQLLL